MIAFSLVLVMREPDLKNTITIAVIFMVLYYVAGLNYKAIIEERVATCAEFGL